MESSENPNKKMHGFKTLLLDCKIMLGVMEHMFMGLMTAFRPLTSSVEVSIYQILSLNY
jgi:hypothetical protein